jgi:NAD(P)-dependent dehydrogenase (short-subunit alcohol dehydrogenase family)
MENNLSQKLAIITGGATGLGFAIARKFTACNIRIIMIGRNEERLKEACQSLGPLAGYVGFDLTRLDEIPGVVESIVKQYKTIDILVNNAGIHLKKDLLEVSNEDFQNIILTNQTALFSFTREIAALMKKQGRGSILNISSMASRYGIPKVIAYTASKSAIEGMTRAMAVELSPFGIRVNCIAPGFIRTNMSAKSLDSDPERKNRVLSRTPLGRLGEPEEVAEAAWFLASDAAAFITGVILPVDGGNSIGF